MATFTTVQEAWSSGGHMIIKCTCGAMLTQCRCIDDSANPRPVNYVQDGCEACAAKVKSNG